MLSATDHLHVVIKVVNYRPYACSLRDVCHWLSVPFN